MLMLFVVSVNFLIFSSYCFFTLHTCSTLYSVLLNWVFCCYVNIISFVSDPSPELWPWPGWDWQAKVMSFFNWGLLHLIFDRLPVLYQQAANVQQSTFSLSVSRTPRRDSGFLAALRLLVGVVSSVPVYSPEAHHLYQAHLFHIMQSTLSSTPVPHHAINSPIKASSTFQSPPDCVPLSTSTCQPIYVLKFLYFVSFWGTES